MKPIGIIRHVDDLGRVVIPREVRKLLEIEEGTSMEILVRGREIILSKHMQRQCECGQAVENNDKYCKNCGKELKDE